MATTPTKYSWYNKTENKIYLWEDKELLNYQRMNNNVCVNVERDNLSKKQMLKGPSKAMLKRLNTNVK